MQAYTIIEEIIKKFSKKFYKVRNKKTTVKTGQKVNVNSNAAQSQNKSANKSRAEANQPQRLQSNLTTNSMGNIWVDPPAAIPAVDPSIAIGGQVGLDARVIAGGKPPESVGDVKTGTTKRKKGKAKVTGLTRRRTRGVVK